RSPEPFMKHFKERGLIVMHKTAGVRFCQTAERVGVDAVANVGYEGGGHPGMDDVSLMILIPKTVDAVKVPVVAAGGIGDARGFVAALALGAEGVLMGTRFMCTKECPIHPKLKEWMVKAQETDTLMVTRSIRDAHRVMKTPTAYQVLGMESRNAQLEELLTVIGGANVKKMIANGDVNAGVMACGQVVGMINSVPTCKEVIDEMVNGAQEIWKRWQTQGIFAAAKR
ncbi:MAG: nitronate monooxygenase, partial [Chloroflexota bacterium]|nr:nitronate monooxygenase [Chloroflexota bacterium]